MMSGTTNTINVVESVQAAFFDDLNHCAVNSTATEPEEAMTDHHTVLGYAGEHEGTKLTSMIVNICKYGL